MTELLQKRVDRPVADALYERLVELRRDFHQHPELSWQEHRTAERIETALEDLDIPHRRVCGTGVVADIDGPEGVPRVALRADMDALPIPEQTGLPFASIHENVMHACGHDGHMAMVLGAGALLRERGTPPAPVRLIFQPAEEKGNGAVGLIDAGALDGVGMIFGGHLDRHYEPGAIVATEGPVNASTDTFHIRICGREGHAGRPHEALDAIVVGSLMVISLQTIVSREINPDHPSVVTVGVFRAGHVSNAIAGQAVLEGTIRAQEPEVREHLHSAVRRVAESAAQLHGASMEFELSAGTPVLYNKPAPTALARKAAARVVGTDHVLDMEHANMGGEDFSVYLGHVPGCYVRFGARVPGGGGFPSHSSEFDFHEEAMAVGAAWLAEIAHVAGRQLRGG